MTDIEFKRAQQIQKSIEFHEKNLPQLDHVIEIKLTSKEKRKPDHELCIQFDKAIEGGYFNKTIIEFIEKLKTDMRNKIDSLKEEFDKL